jgi:predicted short-subunit dehydrogenase-like oxidoreductase (DUF2520 family)
MRESIFLIGAGNVGYHLGRHLVDRGCRVTGVFSRSIEKAQALSELTGIPHCHTFNEIDPTADLYLLAVSDAAIAPAARSLYQMGIRDKLLAHTSGATPSSVLRPYSTRYGVFYPLQTFSRERVLDFSKIPLCIQANGKEDEALLFHLGERLSEAVYRIDDQQRAVLHVAAVFVNNFTNHLFQAGWDILERESLSFDLLRPLIEETAAKVLAYRPSDMQTGPAVRGDQATVDRHLEYLQEQPQLQELYRLLTRHINPDLEV